MWKNPRMIVLTAVVAALFATAYLALSPFSLHLIPGVLTFALRDIFPFVFGIFFGPAGAWGLGIGNLIGDFFSGSLAVGSIFGFATNFLVGYLGFRLWYRYGAADGTQAPNRVRQIVVFLASGLVTAAAGAVVLAWGLNLLGLAPFKIVAVTLFLNLLIGNWVGGLIYVLLYSRIKAIGMIWTSIMSTEEARSAATNLIGTILVSAGGIGGWVAGILLVGSAALTPVVGVFFAAIIVGAFLL
jgi:energy-coupling factor transport system substrate-specific component